jgi:hypothetical protein
MTFQYRSGQLACEEVDLEAIVCTVTTSGLSAWVSGATAMDAPG